MKKEEVVVESFTMDHTAVEAPFARKAGTMTTPKGDTITKFDLRFTQPNQEIMPTASVHGLEHLLAGFMREELDDVVDISPMGCRTGFYLILLGVREEHEVAEGWMRALEKVLKADDIPAKSPVQCGNYRDLSLFGAQEFAKDVLDKLKKKYADVANG